MGNIPSPQRHRQLKRKRGAQKGNQNARKHGFYSAALTLSEICRFWNIANLGGAEPELIVLRIKLASALQHHPANPRVLREAAKLLAKWYCARYGLDRPDKAGFKNIVRNILLHRDTGKVDLDETNRA